MRTSIIYHKTGRFEVETGSTILEASKCLGLFHDCHCDGTGQCLSCVVWILGGEQNCSPVEKHEAQILAAHHLRPPIRLACTTKILGPIRLQILVREESEVTAMMSNPSQIMPPLPGTQLPLVLMKTTLHGFEVFAVNSLPHDSVRILHQFRSTLETLLREHGGQIIETHGASVLAVFGLEGEIRDAINSAVGCSRRLSVACKELKEYLTRHFEANVGLGIGLHVGLTTVGKIGSAPREQWVVLGETRQITEQLLKLTGAAKADILVSEPVFALIRDRFPIKRAFSARMPGKEQRSNVFEVQAQSTGFVMEMAA
ncbi:adenylate/guanylate cyclase domain-containing protein [candidate division KSB1 bacterium]|nr:adenylate/guanylate cyclase domain-containing protein [candidate division KSB1 bacterium]